MVIRLGSLLSLEAEQMAESSRFCLRGEKRKEEEKNCHGVFLSSGPKALVGTKRDMLCFSFVFFFCEDEAMWRVQRCESVKHGNFATFLGDFQILFPALGTGGTQSWKLQIECQTQLICFWVEKKLNEWWKSFPHLVKNEWLRCGTYFFVFILDIKMGDEFVLHSSVSVL